MRYFTLDWWRGVGAEGDPVTAYQAHLAAVRDRLPPALVALEEMPLLHDARLRELVLTPTTGSVVLVLESYAGNERFTLTYTGVERFAGTADPTAGLPGPAGYGDLGYTEADALPGGASEHRLLFSTGIELAVIFRGLELVRAGPG